MSLKASSLTQYNHLHKQASATRKSDNKGKEEKHTFNYSTWEAGGGKYL